MASTVWKGHLTFGLVSIPVRLFRAARAEKIGLHQLYRAPRRETPEAVETSRPKSGPLPTLQPVRVPGETRAAVAGRRAPEPEPEAEAPVTRIRHAAISPEDNTPLARTDVVKGYEYSKDQYVVLDEEDLKKITPSTASEMQIVEFVRFAEIDPIYLETSYYMSPDDAGEKAYALLYDGMRETGYAAVAQVAMHRREHIMILRPGRTGIVTHTMYYPDEVRTTQEFRTDTSLVTPKELELARMLIETLAAPFDPAKFKDTYRERLRELIEAKVAGREVAQVEAPRAAKVVDIVDALQRSLAAAHGAAEAERKPAAATRPTKKRATRRA